MRTSAKTIALITVGLFASSGVLQAAEWAWSGSFSPTHWDPGPASLRIQAGPAPDAYVVIKPTGEIEYGKDYTPDAAAKAFWDAIGGERKARNCQ